MPWPAVLRPDAAVAQALWRALRRHGMYRYAANAAMRRPAMYNTLCFNVLQKAAFRPLICALLPCRRYAFAVRKGTYRFLPVRSRCFISAKYPQNLPSAALFFNAIQGVGRHKVLFFRAGALGLLFFSYFCTEKQSAIFTNKTGEHIYLLNIKNYL